MLQNMKKDLFRNVVHVREIEKRYWVWPLPRTLSLSCVGTNRNRRGKSNYLCHCLPSSGMWLWILTIPLTPSLDPLSTIRDTVRVWENSPLGKPLEARQRRSADFNGKIVSQILSWRETQGPERLDYIHGWGIYSASSFDRAFFFQVGCQDSVVICDQVSVIIRLVPTRSCIHCKKVGPLLFVRNLKGYTHFSGPLLHPWSPGRSAAPQVCCSNWAFQ